jgi:dolichyl-phosphate-mannose-protein mannosyltransferase
MPPYSTHPPLGKLVVALSVWLFGDFPWGWRAANALLGTALVPITYLLARRLFRSKLAASIAASLLLCDGMFLVASREAMINIVYITLGAWAYLVLWCFVQNPVPRTQRIQLVAMSVLLGLFVSSKVLISEVGVLLAVAVVAVVLFLQVPEQPSAKRAYVIARRVIGASGLVGAIVGLVYLGVFLAYHWAEWRGLDDFVAFHQHTLDKNLRFPPHFRDASPFWSWPLLLHPYAYWKRDMLNGTVEVVWCGGNPFLWWAVLPAILIALVRGYTQKSLAWMFLAAGYLANIAMWTPLRRYVFIYSYMPALYFGFLALAGALDECWKGSARRWEHFVLLVPLLPCLILGLGVAWGVVVACSISIGYALMRRYPDGWDGRYVCLVFAAATLLIYTYFFPLWFGIPLSEAAYSSRMWLNGQGLASWL